MLKICKNCGGEHEHEAKGLCHKCYVKLIWKPKKIECKRCKRFLPMKAKGLCGGCYNTVFMLEKTKARNHQERHKIGIELYKIITKRCVLCSFNKIVDLHHLDENKKNNSRNNLIGLCPNHHKMFHDLRYRKEIAKQLREKGLSFKVWFLLFVLRF